MQNSNLLSLIQQCEVQVPLGNSFSTDSKKVYIRFDLQTHNYRTYPHLKLTHLTQTTYEEPHRVPGRGRKEWSDVADQL